MVIVLFDKKGRIDRAGFVFSIDIYGIQIRDSVSLMEFITYWSNSVKKRKSNGNSTMNNVWLFKTSVGIDTFLSMLSKRKIHLGSVPMGKGDKSLGDRHLVDFYDVFVSDVFGYVYVVLPSYQYVVDSSIPSEFYVRSYSLYDVYRSDVKCFVHQSYPEDLDSIDAVSRSPEAFSGEWIYTTCPSNSSRLVKSIVRNGFERIIPFSVGKTRFVTPLSALIPL